MIIKVQTEVFDLSECSIEELETIISVAENILEEKIEEEEIKSLIDNFIDAYTILQERGVSVIVNNPHIEDSDDFYFNY